LPRRWETDPKKRLLEMHTYLAADVHRMQGAQTVRFRYTAAALTGL
jgi:hypothetical protein